VTAPLIHDVGKRPFRLALAVRIEPRDGPPAGRTGETPPSASMTPGNAVPKKRESILVRSGASHEPLLGSLVALIISSCSLVSCDGQPREYAFQHPGATLPAGADFPLEEPVPHRWILEHVFAHLVVPHRQGISFAEAARRIASSFARVCLEHCEGLEATIGCAHQARSMHSLTVAVPV
jgi:hypothetical protein